MEDCLRETLRTVNQWLEFAEKKNAALFAADLALAFGLLKLPVALPWQNQFVSTYCLIASSGLLLSAGICLASFIPQLMIPWIVQRVRLDGSGNLTYFGDIARHSPETYLTAFKNATGMESHAFSGYEEALAEQIVVNSRIALRKYRSFTVSSWISLLCIVTPVGAGLIGLLKLCLSGEDSR